MDKMLVRERDTGVKLRVGKRSSQECSQALLGRVNTGRGWDGERVWSWGEPLSKLVL